MPKKSVCIDCGRPLTRESRSDHQPKLRCRDCFKKFAGVVSGRLKHWANGGKDYPPGDDYEPGK